MNLCLQFCYFGTQGSGEKKGEEELEVKFEKHNNNDDDYYVSVCLGCYDKILQTRQLLNNRNLLLAILEAGSLKLVCLHGLVYVW